MIKNIGMQFADVCEDGDRLWFYDNTHRLICYGDRNFQEIHVEKKIDDKDLEDAGAGIAIFLFDMKLFVVFHVKAVVMTYSLLSKEYSVSVFNRKIELENGKNVYRFRNSLYMFSWKIDGSVLIFHMNRGTFEEINWMKDNDSIFGEECLFPSRNEEKIFFPVYKKNFVIELNLSDLKYVLHRYQNIAIGTICHKGDQTWMTQTTSAELVYIGKLGESIKINSGCENYEEFFSRLIIFEGRIVAIPRFGNYVLVYDCNSKEVIRIFHAAFSVHGKGSLTYGYYCRGSLLYLLPWFIPRLLCVDMETGGIKEKELDLLGIDLGEYVESLCTEHVCLEGDVSLENYLNWIVEGRKEPDNQKDYRSGNGNNIHKEMMKMLKGV